MHEVPFNTDSFFSMLIMLVLVPSLIILTPVMVLGLRLQKIRNKQPYPVTGALLAFLAGFLPAGLWLSWNSDNSIIHYFQHGAPTQFPKWQIYGCGLTIVVLSALVFVTYVRRRNALSVTSVFTAAGFAAAFAHAASFGVLTQQPVGVALSYIGILFLVLVTNGIILGIITVRKRESRT
ncbi:hypothetical protein AALI21_06815 [Corynebacteriaceae bacterium 6-324]|uniref:hypothetical protein n=1 Tax=Corynebacterium sp. TaxID=1720 RepID=UPI0028A7B974|nr:hypothetical protein [Corynebacterium sp.]